MCKNCEKKSKIHVLIKFWWISCVWLFNTILTSGMNSGAWSEEHFVTLQGWCETSGSLFSKMAVDVGMWNVLVMGFAFMFMFTAFQTTSMIEVIYYLSFLELSINIRWAELSFFKVFVESMTFFCFLMWHGTNLANTVSLHKLKSHIDRVKTLKWE